MRKDQIFLLSCGGFIIGVFGGSFFIISWWALLLLGAAGVAVMVTFPHKNIYSLALPFVLLGFGIFSATTALQKTKDVSVATQTVIGTARVVGDTEERTTYRRTVLRMERCENEICPAEKILWQAPLTLSLTPGMRLRFSCTLMLPENFDQKFDYVMFLAKDSIKYLCYKATIIDVQPDDVRARLLRAFFIPKRALESALVKSLPQPEAGLAEGLILGGDNRLPETLQQSFVYAGLSHIVAISGYNIALIAQGFVVLGVGMGLWRRRALWFAALGITAFIFFVGAPPSAIRAGVMAGCVFAALSVGRLSRSLNLLVFAAAFMLFVQPLLLRYDVGFQLSFLATLAIIVTYPWIERLLPQKFFGKGVVELALLTCAVELLVVPLIAYQFHIFSPYALVANVLLLPLVPYAMALAFIGATGFLVIPGLHVIPSTIAYVLLYIITTSAERIGNWPGAVMEVAFGTAGISLWYIGLFFVMVAMERYQYRRYVKEKEIF